MNPTKMLHIELWL